MRGLASIVAGRRTKWLILVVWIIAAVVMSPLGSKLSDVTTDDTESFLPSNAESTEVVRTLDNQFPAKETALALVVYQNKDGLTPADFAKIRSDAEKIKAEPARIPLIRSQPPVLPDPAGPTSKLVSSNRQVAYAVYTFPTDFDHESDWGKAMRDITDSDTGDLNVYVTGDVGFNTDADEVFSNIDTKLLLATTILVLVLLGAIYRSVLVAISPLIVVFVAYQFATGLIYLFAKSGATVSSNSTGIIVVLMFGVGTDYCLLLVSRYREELRRLEDKHDAMQRAVRRAGPAILASGLTVTLAMLVLALAESGNTKSLGPVAAIGVFCSMIAGLTLLPTLLTIFGRQGLLAQAQHRGVRPGACGEGAHGPMAALRGPRPAPARSGPGGHRGSLPAGLAGSDRLQGRLLQHDLLQEVRGERGGLQGAERGLPGRDVVADDGPRRAAGRACYSG